MLRKILSTIGRALGIRQRYDAAETSTRRRNKSTDLVHEDRALTQQQRARLVGGVREAVQNFSFVGWCVRRHLDFVSRLSIDWDTGDEGLDAFLDDWTLERSKPENFDTRGIHDRNRWARMAEARRCLDGDVGMLRRSNRTVQAIEGDRVRNWGGRQTPDGHQWHHGILVDGDGRPQQYALHNRTNHGGLEFAANIDAAAIYWHAWHDAHFRFDAIRGVSPFASAINDFCDIYEGKEYAKARLKVSQLVGIVFTSDAGDGVGPHEVTEELDTDGDGQTDNYKYKVDPGGGPWKIELDSGDDAKFLSPNLGAAETTELLNWVSWMAVRCLDLPISMTDEARTNFHGSKSAITLYLNSAMPKRADNIRMQSAWLKWQLLRGVGDGDIVLPRAVTLDRLLASFTLIPNGLPWFDKSREVKPTLQAIAGGIDSLGRVVAELHGQTLDRWLRRLAREQKKITDSGVILADVSKLVFAPEPTIIGVDTDSQDTAA